MTRSTTKHQFRFKIKRFITEKTPSRKMSSVGDYKKLAYLINALQKKNSVSIDVFREIALNYCTERDKKELIKMYAAMPQMSRWGNSEEVSAWKKRLLSTSDMLECLLRTKEFRKSANKYLFTMLCTLEKKTVITTSACPLCPKLDEIANTFGLSEIDIEIVLFLFLAKTDSIVDTIFDEMCTLTNSRNVRNGTTRHRNAIQLLTGLSPNDLDTALADTGRLLYTGIITAEQELATEVVDFIIGGNSNPFSHRYFSVFDGESIPLESHTLHNRHIEMIRMLSRNKQPEKGINILLYGEPGTGKTEFARALGKDLGYPVYEINTIKEVTDEEEMDQILFRYRALEACEHMVDTTKSIIVVDEADALLNAVPAKFSLKSTADKGHINKLLDRSKGFILWITNRHEGIEESTKRRFDYSIGFDKLSFDQRKSVWRVALQKHNLADQIPEAHIDELGRKYEVSAGGIDVALRNVNRFAGSCGNDEIIGHIDTILTAHRKIINPKTVFQDTRQSRAKEYSLEGLNIKGGANHLVDVFESFNREWSIACDSSEPLSLNTLLYGPPGTGKTEYAKFIARKLNRRLVVKQGSDLLNCYVGETEKLIREAFKEAEHDKAILFIDEADSFIGSREGATQSWEVSQVNEFLTNMESHRGILLCATNFKKILDSAAMRRFFLKLEFDYLSAEGNLIFYDKFFRTLCSTPPTPKEIEIIQKIPCLAPGDFNVVYQKLRFIKQEAICHTAVIGYLREEVECKQGNLGKKMGFA